MQIAVVGAGNIGLVTALSLNEFGFKVICIDNNHSKVNQLKKGESSIFEPGLNDRLSRHLQGGLIAFSSDFESLKNADLIFITVGTPCDSDGHADLKAIHAALDEISGLAADGATIVLKSTVPPGTHRSLSGKYKTLNFISNPEFLREGSAFKDNLIPDRIVIGAEHPENAAKLIEIYKKFDVKKEQILVMDPASAELTKYAANVMLAARLSLMNEFSQICDQVGADIENVRIGVGADKRIGSEFLKAGIGFGGSCFPKDLCALDSFSRKDGLDLKVTRAVFETNTAQVLRFTDRIRDYIQTKNVKTLTIWGTSFKPQTNDMREAPALKIISELLKKTSVHLQIYDLVCFSELEHLYHSNMFISLFKNKYEALENSEGLIVCTEWPEFVDANPEQIKKAMKTPKIFDGRHVFDPKKMKAAGFDYYSVGRAL